MLSVKDGVADRGLNGTATAIAVVLIVAYAALVVVLIAMRDEEHWDRLVYLMGGFEAIVFAGAGWLFGTAVQRGKVEHAVADAQHARADADAAQATAEAARAESDKAKSDAERGLALSYAIKAKGESGSTRLGARPGEEPANPELAELLTLTHRLFPE